MVTINIYTAGGAQSGGNGAEQSGVAPSPQFRINQGGEAIQPNTEDAPRPSEQVAMGGADGNTQAMPVPERNPVEGASDQAAEAPSPTLQPQESSSAGNDLPQPDTNNPNAGPPSGGGMTEPGSQNQGEGAGGAKNKKR